jgi:hypothetical protein
MSKINQVAKVIKTPKTEINNSKQHKNKNELNMGARKNVVKINTVKDDTEPEKSKQKEDNLESWEDELYELLLSYKNTEPVLEYDNWRKTTHGKEVYYKYENLPDISVAISEKLRKDSEKYTKLRNKILEYEKVSGSKTTKKLISNNEKMYRVIKYSNGIKTLTSYTGQTLIEFIFCGLMSIINKKECVFSVFDDLDTVTFTIIGYYKGDISKTEMTRIKNSFVDGKSSGKDTNRVSKNDKIIKLGTTNNNQIICGYYSDIFQKYITEDIRSVIGEKKYYIYRIYKKTDDKRQYIIGSFDVLTEKNIDGIVDKYNIWFGEGILKIEELSCFDCTLECEGLLKVDECILKFDSINQGLNEYFNVLSLCAINEGVSEVQRDAFVCVQKHIMNCTMEDTTDYSKIKGYIACIEDKNNKKFIFYGDNKTPLKTKLNYFYSLCFIQSTKYEKLINLLKGTQFSDMSVEIIETFSDEVNLKEQQYCYIKRFNAIEDGHNSVNFNKTVDMNEIKRMIYAVSKMMK